MQISAITESFADRPLTVAWIVFAIYGAVVAVLVQFLVLPVLAPSLHAGHGLLVGQDSIGYHAIAAEMAASIGQVGWSAWTLAPQGQTAAGLAAPFYYLIAPEPWSLIPINAALHAIAGIMVMQLVRNLEVDWKVAFAGGALWIGLPSTLQWVTQIQKDGYFFAGLLGALLGFSMILRVVGAKADVPAFPDGTRLLVIGIAVAGTARPYGFQLMQVIAAVFSLIAIPIGLASVLHGRLAPVRCVGILCTLVAIVAALGFAPRDTRLDTSAPIATGAAAVAAAPVELIAGKPWQRSEILPAFVDGAFLRLAIARRGYLSSSYASAGSMVDLDLQFHSARDVLAYLPRSIQIGFFAPFPAQWLTPGATRGGTAMRMVAAVEMFILYPLLIIGLPVATWRWQARPEFWLITAFCSFFIVTYACVTPNIGSLYRMRYGFLVTLAGIGLAALWSTVDDRNNQQGI